MRGGEGPARPVKLGEGFTRNFLQNFYFYHAFYLFLSCTKLSISHTPSLTYTTRLNMNSIDKVEQEIQAKGLTAPRITPADIEANIVSEHYFTAAQGVYGAGSATNSNPESLSLLTFCVLVLRNGFTVTGESACASSENFDAGIGRKIARNEAVGKIWPLMGYELKTKLAKKVA